MSQRVVIEQIGDIDIELIADRHDPGEPDAALRSPIHHSGRDRAGLRDQREVARPRHVRGKAGIEADAGHHDAETVRPNQPATAALRALQDRRPRAGTPVP